MNILASSRLARSYSYKAYFTARYFSSNLNYKSPNNPQIFMQVSRDGEPLGKMVFELYANHCPKTAENFRSICAGDNEKKYTYKKSLFHRIIGGFMAQGGDFTNGDGTGGLSIYGAKFPDENLKLRHFKRGLLSMANSGPNTNGSQFFITFGPTDWLDGYHVVFGELVEGDSILRQLELAGSRNGKPSSKIVIEDCGVVKKVEDTSAAKTPVQMSSNHKDDQQKLDRKDSLLHFSLNSSPIPTVSAYDQKNQILQSATSALAQQQFTPFQNSPKKKNSVHKSSINSGNKPVCLNMGSIYDINHQVSPSKILRPVLATSNAVPSSQSYLTQLLAQDLGEGSISNNKVFPQRSRPANESSHKKLFDNDNDNPKISSNGNVMQQSSTPQSEIKLRIKKDSQQRLINSGDVSQTKEKASLFEEAHLDDIDEYTPPDDQDFEQFSENGKSELEDKMSLLNHQQQEELIQSLRRSVVEKSASKVVNNSHYNYQQQQHMTPNNMLICSLNQQLVTHTSPVKKSFIQTKKYESVKSSSRQQYSQNQVTKSAIKPLKNIHDPIIGISTQSHINTASNHQLVNSASQGLKKSSNLQSVTVLDNSCSSSSRLTPSSALAKRQNILGCNAGIVQHSLGNSIQQEIQFIAMENTNNTDQSLLAGQVPQIHQKNFGQSQSTTAARKNPSVFVPQKSKMIIGVKEEQTTISTTAESTLKGNQKQSFASKMNQLEHQQHQNQSQQSNISTRKQSYGGMNSQSFVIQQRKNTEQVRQKNSIQGNTIIQTQQITEQTSSSYEQLHTDGIEQNSLDRSSFIKEKKHSVSNKSLVDKFSSSTPNNQSLNNTMNAGKSIYNPFKTQAEEPYKQYSQPTSALGNAQHSMFSQIMMQQSKLKSNYQPPSAKKKKKKTLNNIGSTVINKNLPISTQILPHSQISKIGTPNNQNRAQASTHNHSLILPSQHEKDDNNENRKKEDYQTNQKHRPSTKEVNPYVKKNDENLIKEMILQPLKTNKRSNSNSRVCSSATGIQPSVSSNLQRKMTTGNMIPPSNNNNQKQYVQNAYQQQQQQTYQALTQIINQTPSVLATRQPSSQIHQQTEKPKKKTWTLTETEKQTYGDRVPKGYEKLDLLGKGGCAIVWLAKNLQNNEIVALKQFPKQKASSQLDGTAKVEVNLGRILFPKNEQDGKTSYGLDPKAYPGIKSIAKLIDDIEDSKDYWLVYEVGSHSLNKHLFDVKGEFYKGERLYLIQHQNLFQELKSNPNLLRILIKKMSECFEVLSQVKIVHADIKPDNILVSFDGKDIKDVKLIDFGSAFSYENPSNIQASTPEYLAPEVLEYLDNRAQNTMANGTNSTNLCKRLQPWSYDIWSLGAILLEILTGFPLWLSLKGRIQTPQGKSIIGQGMFGVQGREGKKILIKQQQLLKNIPQTLKKYDCFGLDRDEDFMNLLERMLDFDPLNRISPSEVLQHPYITRKQ